MKKLYLVFIMPALFSILALIGCANAADTSTEVVPTEAQIKACQERVDFVEAELNVPRELSKFSSSVNLPTEIDGVAINWKSSDASVLNAEDGTITPKETDTKVIVTATLSYKGVSNKHDFEVLVYGTTSKFTENQEQVYQKKIAIVKSGLFIPEKMGSFSSPLKLQKDSDGIKIDWESSDPSILNVDNGIVMPKETDENITLTASLSYKGLTAQRNFNILVYGITSALDDDIILDLAVAQLPKTFPFDSKTVQYEVAKQESMNINGKVVSVTNSITSESSNLFDDTSNNKFVISRDFKDYSVNYNVTLNLNGKSKTVTSSILIPKITEYVKYKSAEYSSNSIRQTVTYYPDYFEVINESLDGNGSVLFKNGTRYLYTVDTLDKTIMVEESAYYDIDRWVTRQEDMEKDLNEDLVYFYALKDFESNPTFEGYKTFLSKSRKDEIDRYDFYMVRDLGQYMEPKVEISDYKDTEAIKKFNDKSIEEKNKAADKFFKNEKDVNIAPGYTIEEYIAATISSYPEFYDKYFPPFKSNAKYSVSNNIFNINTEYDGAKGWSEQNGSFVNKRTSRNEYCFEELNITNYAERLGMLRNYDPRLHYTVGVLVKFNNNDFKDFTILEGNLKDQTGSITFDSVGKKITISMTINNKPISYDLDYRAISIL